MSDPMTASIDAFIRWNPTMIIVTRREKVQTDAGGWLWQATGELEPQMVRIQPAAGPLTGARGSSDQQVVPAWQIVGTLSIDLQEGDLFEDADGRELYVNFVRYDQYACRAEAIEARHVTVVP